LTEHPNVTLKWLEKVLSVGMSFRSTPLTDEKSKNAFHA
jgi:hypothetical protein